MNLVTGKKSNAHVSSDDFRKIVESLVGGGGSFVSSVGTGLQTSVSGTTLSIGKGMIVHHGCVFETSNSGDTVSFQAGSSGMNRIDLICVKYTRNNTTGIEDAVWNVLQGTATSGTPVQPTVPSGDLRDDNATQDYCPVFKLTLTGNTPTVRLLLNTIPIDGAYSKPSTGIPKSDLVNTVQASLGLADRAVQMDKLYHNPSPTDAFSERQIQLSLTGYSGVIVVAKYVNNDDGCISVYTPIGVSGLLIGYAGYQISTSTYLFSTRRFFDTATSGITFHNAKGPNNEESNNYLIPYEIYGIKGVQDAAN